MGTASETEVRAVHLRLRELAAAESPEAFHERAPALLADLIPAENVVLNLLGPNAEVLATTVHGISIPSWIPSLWRRHAASHPVAEYMRVTRDPAPRTLSDFWSPRRLHASDLYSEIFSPLSLEDQLSVYADPGRDGVLGVSFNRNSRSFGDRDRRVAELLTAGLTSAYAAVRGRSSGLVARTETLGLTPRQAEVLHHLTAGATYVQVGVRMGITLATVRTHVERLYTHLGVCSRGEAVALLLGAAPSETTLLCESRRPRSSQTSSSTS